MPRFAFSAYVAFVVVVGRAIVVVVDIKISSSIRWECEELCRVVVVVVSFAIIKERVKANARFCEEDRPSSASYFF